MLGVVSAAKTRMFHSAACFSCRVIILKHFRTGHPTGQMCSICSRPPSRRSRWPSATRAPGCFTAMSPITSTQAWRPRTPCTPREARNPRSLLYLCIYTQCSIFNSTKTWIKWEENTISWNFYIYLCIYLPVLPVLCGACWERGVSEVERIGRCFVFLSFCMCLLLST